MDVLAVSLALAAHVFPWACHQHLPEVEVVHHAKLPPRWAAAAYQNGHPHCRIYLGARWYRLTPGRKCRTILHERAHLAGLRHTTTNRRSVMFHPYSGQVDKRCKRVLKHGPWWSSTR